MEPENWRALRAHSFQAKEQGLQHVYLDSRFMVRGLRAQEALLGDGG